MSDKKSKVAEERDELQALFDDIKRHRQRIAQKDPNRATPKQNHDELSKTVMSCIEDLSAFLLAMRNWQVQVFEDMDNRITDLEEGALGDGLDSEESELVLSLISEARDIMSTVKDLVTGDAAAKMADWIKRSTEIEAALEPDESEGEGEADDTDGPEGDEDEPDGNNGE